MQRGSTVQRATEFFVPSRATGRTLIWLAVALIPGFLATAAATRALKAEQRVLASEWTSRGEAALAAGKPVEAIEALRNALVYDRESRERRLRLAQALIAADRRTEARAYLIALWEPQPGSGPVNLELARLAAREGDLPAGLWYYHHAIEGAWDGRTEGRRREARLELTEFLIDRRASAQAQAELLVLLEQLPDDPGQRLRIADLLVRADLPSRAVPLYRDVLKVLPDDPRALRGAGAAAFADGAYAATVAYLTKAAARGVTGTEENGRLEIARLVLALDPYQRRLSTRERTSRAHRALAIASDRLRRCLPAMASDPALQRLEAETAVTRPAIDRALVRDPDTIDAAIDLAFRIEQAASVCGDPTPADRALLLLSGQRAGTVP
jgi:Tfp pilus assembly protein PilF